MGDDSLETSRQDDDLWSNRRRIEAESDEISMTAEQITSQLQPLIGEIHSQHFCYLLVESWIAAGIGPEEVIEPVLRFMEQNTDVDFGLPGPLIQFMERSLKQDQARRDCFEELLIKSVQRKPVHYTIWMINRILNVTVEPRGRHRLLEALEGAGQRSQNDPDLLEAIDDFLTYQAKKSDT